MVKYTCSSGLRLAATAVDEAVEHTPETDSNMDSLSGQMPCLFRPQDEPADAVQRTLAEAAVQSRNSMMQLMLGVPVATFISVDH